MTRPAVKLPARDTPERDQLADLRARFANVWTPAEDELLRTHYERIGLRPTAALMGRSVHAVAHRVRVLGLSRRRRWTDADKRRLRMLWGELSVARIATLLGRTKAATFWHAQMMGLPLGVQPGMESVTAAARRTGFALGTLQGILRWAGVNMARTMSGPRPRRGRGVRPAYVFRQVDVVDVDDAIERWMSHESVDAAARRHGISGDCLTKWLVQSGEELPPRRRKCHWRIPSEVIDRVVAARRELETVPEACARTGMRRMTLSRWLDRAGIPRFGARGKQVRPADVDRLIAGMTDRQRAYLERGRKISATRLAGMRVEPASGGEEAA